MDPVVLQLTGGLPFILLLAVFLAAVSSQVLLRAYRRAVVASMRARGSAAAANLESREPGGEPVPPTARLSIEIVDQGRVGDAAAPSLEAAYSASVRAPLRNATIYCVGGLAYSAVMALATLVSAGEPVSLIRLVVLLWLFLWPAVLSVDRVVPAVRGLRPTLLLGYFGVWILLGATAIGVSGELTWREVWALWVIVNLPATILVLAFLNGRVRAVGPLVLVFSFLGMFGANLALAAAGSSDALLRVIAGLGSALGVGAYGAFFGLIVAGFAVGGFLASRFGLPWIRRRYESKRLSDQTLTVDSIWLTFAVVQAIPLAFEGAWWVVSGVVAFLLYRAIVGVGLSRWARPVFTSGQAPRLLLLRVFALGRRSEALFGRLDRWWRHVGSIQMIAGPDLATTTVEPHEFLDFLGRRLDRRFIADEATLALRLSEMDLVPDVDGRYRVHDFFCHDDTWRMVLSRLVRESDVILMDLRGFSRNNSGVLHELGELVNLAPLERVILVIDETTDEAFLRSSVEHFWQRMRADSPNRGADRRLTIFRSTGSPGRDIAGLVRWVLSATMAAHPERTDLGVAAQG